MRYRQAPTTRTPLGILLALALMGVLGALGLAGCSGGGDADGSGSARPGEGADVASLTPPAKAAHPLDALTPSELDTFREVLAAGGYLGGSAFPYLALDEPDKQSVLAWKPGSAFARRAFAVVRRQGRTFEAVVDIGARSVVSWVEKPGAATGFATSEFGTASSAATADGRLAAALALRGLSVGEVTLLTFAGGSVSDPAEQGRRIARVVPFRAAGDAATLLSRPVEGLFASVDLDTGEVLSVTDTGAVPVSLGGPVAEAGRQRPALDPVVFTPNGMSNIDVDGTEVRWAGWSMRWRGNRRTGVELADVRFNTGSGARPVMYEASVSDLFVPYQHPDPSWTFRTLLDSAEFGLGNTLSTLRPGVDCPVGAGYFDVVLPDDAARATVKPRTLCTFERPTGNPAYRHEASAAAETEMVLRWISVVGNYDYIVDSVFGADGSVRFHVFAAGIVLQRGTAAATVAEAHSIGEDEHGVLVGEGLLAVNHDHYLSFRLDLDVGDTGNRLVRQRLVPEAVEGNPGRSGIWRVDEQVVGSELGARYTPNPREPERVLVQSVAASGPLGHHPGYEFEFGDSVAVSSTAVVDDPGSRRGGWAADTLWVTPYAHDERFASGLYIPDGSAPAGLAAWTAADRAIRDTDLVVWFTVGFHHVVRTEDLANMPAHESEFGLKPANVYPTNPLLP